MKNALLFVPVLALLSACTTTKPEQKPPVAFKECDAKTAARSTGQLHWPLRGKVTGNFAKLKGITISAKTGTPVLAADDGEVAYTGNALRGYGNLIIITHGSVFRTAYGHNEKILVKTGQKVKAGQQIATVGSTDAKHPQLHFEVRKNGIAVDPCLYLAK